MVTTREVNGPMIAYVVGRIAMGDGALLLRDTVQISFGEEMTRSFWTWKMSTLSTAPVSASLSVRTCRFAAMAASLSW